ncbi:hypothetical protein [Cryobacterium sp. PAMC25264]|uniref:hypothetical protein n=1 Tax=Cryobacterium sp. PAMC25264 TaxID=2861288 RepID=UPI001C62CA3C|nr:hypothetical protein [Cryobacterium sp. PAMC25264]QYF73329.1 hypothetical protein KY500_16645 [Cryobacterium sp. PAMC25264]
MTNPHVSDQEPLEWFWPPTAPILYGGVPAPIDEETRQRPHMLIPVQTPWKKPTRITRTGTTWTVRYGTAPAQKPARVRKYPDDAALMNDLERLECWPMTIEETRQIRAVRVIQVLNANAQDDFYPAMFVTEPYASRMNALQAHQTSEATRAPLPAADTWRPPRAPGDLRSQLILLEAEAWASAVRTVRAGGTGWNMDGPVVS